MARGYPRLLMHRGAFLVDEVPTWTRSPHLAKMIPFLEVKELLVKLKALGYDDVNVVVLNPETRDLFRFILSAIERGKRT